MLIRLVILDLHNLDAVPATEYYHKELKVTYSDSDLVRVLRLRYHQPSGQLYCPGCQLLYGHKGIGRHYKIHEGPNVASCLLVDPVKEEMHSRESRSAA